MTASYLRLDFTRPDSRGFGTSTSRTGAQALRRLLNEVEAGVVGAHSITSAVARESLVAAAGTITLASCAAKTVIRINGVAFTAVSTTPVVANNEFDVSGTDTADATSLAAAINVSTDTAISGVLTATSALGVVTLTSTRLGYTANAITIATDGVVAFGTVTAATVVATNTFTVNGVTFTARKEMARGTVTCASVVAGDTVTINGQVFIAADGSTGNNTFDISGDDASTCANLATAINSNAILSAYLAATDDGASVTKIRHTTSGTAGNAVTLATSDNTRLAKSGTTLSGGQATSATTWDYGDTNAQAAAEMTRCVNASTNALVSAEVRALTNADVSTLYSKLPGLAGNRITLASSDGGTLAVSGARLTGGTVASWEGAQATGTVTLSSGSGTITATINGVAVAITWASSDTNSAALLAAAINSSTDALVRGGVTATSSAGVTTITAVRGGVEGNNVTLAASGTGATASVTRLAGGAVPATVVFSAARLSGGSTGAPVTYTL